MPKLWSPAEGLLAVVVTFGVRELSSVVESKGMSGRLVRRRLPSEVLSCWTHPSHAPIVRHSRTWTRYPTWRSSKVCLLFSGHVSACLWLFVPVAAQNACAMLNMSSLHLCGEAKTQKSKELAPVIARTKGCHQKALFIGLLPPDEGIPPRNLVSCKRRIRSARLQHAVRDPNDG